VVQGVTEVLPVSSSAHLALVPALLGWAPAADRTAFAAALHAGSCAGVAWVLRDDLRRLDAGTAGLVAAASVPAAVAGALAVDAVERRLGGPRQLAACLAAAGAALWLADRRPASATAVGPRAAAYAGLAQTVALVPGVSRSGAALTALRAAGVERGAAERFSLLLSLPVTGGAAVLTLARRRRLEPGAVVGAATAAAGAAAAGSWLARRPARNLSGVALYRLALAAVVAVRLRREGQA
jgi:undecaprenyl-diphosphatase